MLEDRMRSFEDHSKKSKHNTLAESKKQLDDKNALMKSKQTNLLKSSISNNNLAEKSECESYFTSM